MLHLAKLAVGVRDIAHLRDLQAARAAARPPLRHQTRSFPRRTAEITGGGSIYWVIRGAMVVRQRVLAVVEDQWDDSTRCAGLVLHPELVPVAGRVTRPAGVMPALVTQDSTWGLQHLGLLAPRKSVLDRLIFRRFVGSDRGNPSCPLCACSL